MYLVTEFGGFILSKGTAVDNWRSRSTAGLCALHIYSCSMMYIVLQ
jgi:hypothetical protein